MTEQAGDSTGSEPAPAVDTGLACLVMMVAFLERAA